MGACGSRARMGDVPQDLQDGIDGLAIPSEEENPTVLASIESRLASDIVFTNNTDVNVRLIWVNYDGVDSNYRMIAPRTVYRQPTYVTHPWRFKSIADDERQIIVTSEKRTVVMPTEGTVTVDLCMAEPIQWSPSTHSQFSEEFKREARAFLLCHHRAEALLLGHIAPPPKAVNSHPLGVQGGEVSPGCPDRGMPPAGEQEWVHAGDGAGEENTLVEETLGSLPLHLIHVVIGHLAPWIPDISHEPAPPAELRVVDMEVNAQ